ncbi:Imm43 family immunity protein [Neisseria polysaccharea]|uniref:Imm43 family immunity protein n=1 Tax=Neisseria polysaccharea TaxID=489 RepID=UPI00272A77B2|nr:Imm43 family immunity protein [Neisseria polysaccharea]
MKKLMVWGYSAQSLDELAKRKVPKVSLGEVGISEEFNPKKTHPDFDFPWSWFVKGQEIPPMPEKVYVCLKKARSVTFDFLPYSDFFIMSDRFLEFIKKYGFEHNFGISKVVIVNTKGELLTDETYYLIRIVSWEIEDEIIYPDLGMDEEGFSLEAYTNSDKDILLSTNHNYSRAFMVSENLKDKILENFSLPFLYTLKEWKEQNDYEIIGFDKS